MKVTFSIILSIALLISCSKRSDNNGSQTFKTPGGTTLNITAASWQAIRLGANAENGGYVNLNMVGSTNANGMKISRRLVNIVSDTTINFYSQTNFTLAVEVTSFTANSIPSGYFNDSTTVKVYKGNDTLIVLIKGNSLHF